MIATSGSPESYGGKFKIGGCYKMATSVIDGEAIEVNAASGGPGAHLASGSTSGSGSNNVISGQSSGPHVLLKGKLHTIIKTTDQLQWFLLLF